MNITDNDFIELRVRAYSTRSADGRAFLESIEDPRATDQIVNKGTE